MIRGRTGTSGTRARRDLTIFLTGLPFEFELLSWTTSISWAAMLSLHFCPYTSPRLAAGRTPSKTCFFLAFLRVTQSEFALPFLNQFLMQQIYGKCSSKRTQPILISKEDFLSPLCLSNSMAAEEAGHDVSSLLLRYNSSYPFVAVWSWNLHHKHQTWVRLNFLFDSTQSQKFLIRLNS